MKNNLNTLIAEQKERILSTGKDARLYGIYKNAVMELISSSTLEGCEPASIVREAVRIVELGLNPNPLVGEAFVVPRSVFVKNNKGKKVFSHKEAKLQISSKGYQVLAYRVGWKVTSYHVYECDNFSIHSNGMEEDYKLIPNHDRRDEENHEWVYKNLKGVLVFAKDTKGEVFSRYVKKAKLEKIRLNSDNQSPGKLTHIWAEWPEEMYNKSAIKYHLKRLPMDSRVSDAVIMDEEMEREHNDIPKAGEQAPLEISAKSTQSTIKSANGDIPKILKNMGLDYYIFEETIVIQGNAFTHAKTLEDLGFKHKDKEWYIDLPKDTEELIKVFYPNYAVEIAQKDSFIYYGLKAAKEEGILADLGFTYSDRKAIWYKKQAV